MNDNASDIDLERSLVEQNANQPTTDDVSPEEQHRRAQETGEVFEGERYGGQ